MAEDTSSAASVVASTTGNSSSVVANLPDSQVFSRDAEDYTQENLADTIERLKKVVTRYRKARNDNAEVAEATAKFKKANAAAAKKKTKSADPLDTKV